MMMPPSKIVPGMRPPTYHHTTVVKKQIIELDDSHEEPNIYGSITSEHHQRPFKVIDDRLPSSPSSMMNMNFRAFQ